MTDKLLNLIEQKNSQLCIGLDPRIDPKNRVSWAIDLIEKTNQFAVAYKPNRQFWLGVSLEEMQRITRKIHESDAIAIIDHKLSDIGSSNEGAIKWAASEGFDYITVSPFPGNLEATCQLGEQYGIGVIGLVLMSNPEAEYLLQYDYQGWARICGKFNGGAVIGTTNHIEEKHIVEVKKALDTGFVLAPGLGKQGGKVGLVKSHFGKKAIFNVSRGISQAEDPVKAAEYFVNEINNLRTQ